MGAFLRLWLDRGA
ncbi:hypothetical protein D030_1490A, partial [Vibrio parahaemolyticus AQ3810]